ncbi:MAG: NYN domain-containing protein [Burkholderiaceae bacterium]|jgi:uncharacterized LabA/DUF88 family protein|nr:NYN domain-containing protein [Burkholderiaceae bacterium]
MTTNAIARIAVFFDGTFYSMVSSYYRHIHSRKLNLSFTGVHEFIRHCIAKQEQVDVNFCQIVESHFFRGRFSLNMAIERDSLTADRFVDQLLMNAGIVSHYYPMNENANPPEEKGIDVWLALEAYDLAVHKRADVLVLFSGDQDFVPMVRKVNSTGTRVMLLTEDVRWTDVHGQSRYINVSQRLSNESTYRVILSEEIEKPHPPEEAQIIDGLFVQ